MKALVVREPFGDYAKGQAITDPEAISAVEEAGQAHFCTPTEFADGFFASDEPSAPKGAKSPAASPASDA